MNIRKITLQVLFFAAAVPAFATNIVIPNGNFTNASDDGKIGGGLIATSGAGQIGSGPWSGSYNAVAGLLVPPSLQIVDSAGGGTATISGIAGLNVLGDLLNNSGWFDQSLAGTPYMANTQYTLSADVDADTLLSVSALDNFGAGIALLNGNNILASSADSSQIVKLFLLGGFEYQIQLQITTGATAPLGNIGVQLFDDPDGLATVSLLNSVTFSNVTLDAEPAGTGGTATPEPRESLLTGFCMVLVAGLWKKVQRKRAQQ